MIRIICFTAALATLGVPAGADEYWVAYEGDDFPENVGWERLFGNGGADRWIEDGALVIDSTRDLQIHDAYRISDIADPDPGELFVAEWRVRIDEFITYYDAVLVVARTGSPGDMTIVHGLDHVRTWREWERIDVAAGQWHTYRVESENMVEYDLFVDETFRFRGQFESQSILQSYLSFGNGAIGAASLSRWDYVRFGVVPEPSGAVCFALVLVAWRHRS